MTRKWRCYVCGKPLGQNFSLISYASEADRVFLVGNDCVAVVDDVSFSVEVQELLPKAERMNQ